MVLNAEINTVGKLRAELSQFSDHEKLEIRYNCEPHHYRRIYEANDGRIVATVMLAQRSEIDPKLIQLWLW